MSLDLSVETYKYCLLKFVRVVKIVIQLRHYIFTN